MEFYKVENKADPACIKCSKVYPATTDATVCTELYGKGKERMECGGEILKWTRLSWSTELLKDYSAVEKGDLSLFDDVMRPINEKLDALKIGETKDTGITKVNVASEIEQAMRSRGINILSWTREKMDREGRVETDMATESFYKIPLGISKMSEFGYMELRGRFEEMPRVDKADPEGFLVFTKLEKGKEVKRKQSKKKLDKLTCPHCGFKAKSKFGLQAHMRACKAKK